MNKLLTNLREFFLSPAKYVGKELQVVGKVAAVRKLGKTFGFVLLDTPYGELQGVVSDGNFPPKGSCLKVVGTISESQLKTTDLKGYDLQIASFSLWENHAESARESASILRKLSQKSGRRVFELKSSVLKATRDFLASEEFVEIYTPKIVGAISEGPLDAFEVSFYETEGFLSVSNLLFHSAVVSSGLPRVYEIGPSFRGNKSNTKYHLNEFTTLDYSASYASREDLMNLTDRLIQAVIEEIQQHELGVQAEKFWSVMTSSIVVDYREVYDYLNSQGCVIHWGEDRPLPRESFALLRKRYGIGLIWVIDQPKAKSPFYLDSAVDELGDEVSLNCTLLHPYFGSLFDGGERLISVPKLNTNLEMKGLNKESFQFYIDCISQGAPPIAGGGIGFDRFFQALIGLDDIRDGVLFPVDVKSNLV